MTTHHIGLDVHCQFTEFAVVTSSGRVTKRGQCPTTIPALVAAIESVKRPRYVAFEEGPMAEWLYRSLLPSANGVTACEPRRNRWIAHDGEKDDPLDAAKVAQLHRGGYLKAVHHPESEQRSMLKGHVSVYHDRVRQRVRTANRISAQFRSHGVVIQEDHFATAAQREGLLRRLPADPLLRKDLKLLWESYDLTALHVAELERSLKQLARKHEPLRRFQEVPGIGPVWAATFYAYVDTPWRFRSKEALWKYLGIGLERRHSGNGPVQLQVPKAANRRLKWMILSAAVSANITKLPTSHANIVTHYPRSASRTNALPPVGMKPISKKSFSEHDLWCNRLASPGRLLARAETRGKRQSSTRFTPGILLDPDRQLQ